MSDAAERFVTKRHLRDSPPSSLDSICASERAGRKSGFEVADVPLQLRPVSGAAFLLARCAS